MMKTRRSHLACFATAMAALLLLSTGIRGGDGRKPAVPARAATPANAPATGAARGAVTPATGRGSTPGATPATGRSATPGTTGRGGTTPAATTPGAGARVGASFAPATGGAPTGSGNPTGRGNSFAGREQPRGANTVRTANGSAFSRRTDGKPRDVHVAGRNMDIHHGLAGDRRVSIERPDHSRIVAERGRGFVDHLYAFHGREFAHRTYVVNGRVYDRFYGRYEYRPGVFIDVYAPVRFYPVSFYGWVYNPWVVPVPYAWGWAAAPWYGYYGWFFTPYPVYANASLWLTDYLISQSLIAAYQEQPAAQPAQPLPPGQVALTPDVKQAIADEVRREIALENAEAQSNAQGADFNGQSSGIARLLADNMPHMFVAGSDLDVIDASGQECAISMGDVLQLASPPPPAAASANLIVMAGKNGVECPRGDVVSVALEDLQDMQNHMRETIDDGLGTLQARNSGLPTPPPSALARVIPASFSVGAPPPDQNAGSQISQQFQEADRAEQVALSQASPAPLAAPQGPPQTVSLGQSTVEVIGTLGQPRSIMDLGPKKIYVYPDLKITFKDGRVSDVD